MKIKTLIITAMAVMFLVPFSIPAVQADSGTSEGAPADPGNYPVAEFPKKKFQFDPVLEGKEIVHDFLVRNTGKAELNINKVLTG